MNHNENGQIFNGGWNKAIRDIYNSKMFDNLGSFLYNKDRKDQNKKGIDILKHLKQLKRDWSNEVFHFLWKNGDSFGASRCARAEVAQNFVSCARNLGCVFSQI